ncbi:MAG: hypothetical protein FWE74_02735 [Oscillospiraceae bacterium]|nr:hypothetical protein [Oscillospiraceae bacterium]
MGIKNLKRILGKKGESLVLVLILMFFFMIICVSVSSAAISGIRYTGMQREYNEAMLLERSLHDNIMFSLQSDAANTLGRGILNGILNSINENENATIPINNNFDVEVTIRETISDDTSPLNALIAPGGAGRIRIDSVRLNISGQVIPREPVSASYNRSVLVIECFNIDVCQTAKYDICPDAGCYTVCRYTKPHTHCPDTDCPDWEVIAGHYCCSWMPECPWDTHLCGEPGNVCIIECAIDHHRCVIKLGICQIDPMALVGRAPWHDCGDSSTCILTDDVETRDGERIEETFVAPRNPRSVIIIADLIVTVRVNSNGRIIESQIEYSYSGGELSDCLKHYEPADRPPGYNLSECDPTPLPGATLPEGINAYCCMKKGEFNNTVNFVADGRGRWEFERYDIIG